MEIQEKREQFLSKLKKEFPENFESILANITKPLPTTFRIISPSKNTSEVLASLKKQGFSIDSGPIDNSYVVIFGEKRLSETPEFEAGKLYIQSISSMLPVLALDLQNDDVVLDMCAAPGSKTSLISEITSDKATIIAVETNRSRYFRLKQNLEKYHCNNVTVLNDNAINLPVKYSQYLNYFDKVLLDAPCSNEGQICLSDDSSYKFWNPKLSKKISKLQKRLLVAGLKMLKPGGILVYSTCTFSKLENEEVIQWILKNNTDVSLASEERVYPTNQLSAFYFAKLQKK